jgi:hypothetical protein
LAAGGGGWGAGRGTFHAPHHYNTDGSVFDVFIFMALELQEGYLGAVGRVYLSIEKAYRDRKL